MAKKTSKPAPDDKPVVAILTITNCENCPFMQSRNNYTADSFEKSYNWFCNKKKGLTNDGKIIASDVAWNEGKDVKIPKWCPIRKKD